MPHERFRSIIRPDVWRSALDHWLTPVALATFCVLVGAQMLTRIPAVRAHVDVVEGRLVRTVTTSKIPATALQEAATIDLYVSPNGSYPDIQVSVNGKAVGTFAKPSLTISLHAGDVVQFRATQRLTAYIMVDHNNAKLLTPAPGQTFTLTADAPVVTLPPTTFVS